MDPQPVSTHAGPSERSSEQILWRGHPDWRGQIGWHLKALLVVFFLVGISYLLKVAGVIAGGVIILVGVVLTAAMVLVGRLIRTSTVYTITNQRVVMKFGILNHTTEQARIKKIDNVTIKQSLFDRMLGIGSINFDTAADRVDILDFWGVRSPKKCEELVDRVRFGYADLGLNDDELAP